jgi:hypothetical protein
MDNRTRENRTLNFQKNVDRGSVQETFYPWNQTVDRFKRDGMPAELGDAIFPAKSREYSKPERIFSTAMVDSVYNYERYFGFDGVKRITFNVPFSADRSYKSKISNEDDWKQLKEWCYKEIDQYYTVENMQAMYGKLKEGHDQGEYSVRLNIMGFFWTPRELMGDEEHLYAFYDYPEMLHDMNQFLVDTYTDKLAKAMEILPADLIYVQEDLSGKTGPMISQALFDEFVGDYYRKIIPVLKSKGVKNVFVDTDGDFMELIPNFLDAGVDGFLPVDVNAGMDIVEVRKEFPTVRLIGGYNKLCIADGPEAIDREFERLMPVIAHGGFIPGCDHQVAPSTSLLDYKYYVKKLKEVMTEAYR